MGYNILCGGQSMQPDTSFQTYYGKQNFISLNKTLLLALISLKKYALKTHIFFSQQNNNENLTDTYHI